jgi:hypothetical protein
MKRITLKTSLRFLIPALVLWFGLAQAGCTSTQAVRATIVDEAGRPIPGALLYVEAYKHPGAFDFAYALSGSDGEVPPSGSPPLTIGWRRGAKVALAAFAPGKQPVVLYDPLGNVVPEGMEIRLADVPEVGKRWEPRIAKLSFPFEESPDLAARASAPEAEAVRRAFEAAYAPLANGEETMLPVEQVKLEALRRLGNPSAPNQDPNPD